jgi:nucleoside-diphosphate-sugar epimerase
MSKKSNGFNVPFYDNLTLTASTTGANRGIGFELTTRFLERGYIVYGTFRPQTREDPSVADASFFPALLRGEYLS